MRFNNEEEYNNYNQVIQRISKELREDTHSLFTKLMLPGGKIKPAPDILKLVERDPSEYYITGKGVAKITIKDSKGHLKDLV